MYKEYKIYGLDFLKLKQKKQFYIFNKKLYSAY